MVSKLFSFHLSVKLNVLINFLHTLGPPSISRLSVSLPSLFCFLGDSRKFPLYTVYSFIPYSDAYLLLPLPSFLAGMESPFSHPLQSDLLLWRFLAPGASLALGEGALAMSSPGPEDESFLLGFCISSVMVMLPGFVPLLSGQRESQEG